MLIHDTTSIHVP